MSLCVRFQELAQVWAIAHLLLLGHIPALLKTTASNNCCVYSDLQIYLLTYLLKGELNLDNKWKSDDLFYIIRNEIHPRFNQFCVILKLSQFIYKIYLLLNIANLA